MLLMVEVVVMSLVMVAVSLMFVVSMMESLMFTTTRIAPAPADFVSRVILSPIIVPYTYLAMLFAMLAMLFALVLTKSNWMSQNSLAYPQTHSERHVES